MLILAINTASSKTAIALFEKKKHVLKLIAEDSWISENREAEKLMPAIENILNSPAERTCLPDRQADIANKMSGWKTDTLNYTDIGAIYIIKGPGSFTGLRVGVTVANTLAYLLGCKLYGITTFEYWHTAQPYPVLIYAGSGGVYFSSPAGKPLLLQLPEAEKFLKMKKIKTVCGDITIQQKQHLKTVKFVECKKTFGEIMKKIIENQTLKPVKMIEPVYIKPPGITRNFALQNFLANKSFAPAKHH